MALNKQPVIATDPMTRIPDEIPSAKNSASIKPINASINPLQPIAVSELPTIISMLPICLLDLITLDCDRCESGIFTKSQTLRVELPPKI